MKNNKLRLVWALLAAVLALAGPLEARTKKGDKYLKQGKEAEDRQMWDDALGFYEKAQATDPSDPGYMLSVKRARFQASQKHVDLGRKLRGEGQLEGAAQEFQKAILMDPGSAIALEEWKRTSEMLEQEKASGKRAEGAERGLTPVEKEKKEIDERMRAMLPPPELKPISQLPSTLKMNNQPPKVLYETLGKLAGINVVFDPQFQATGKNYNLDLSNATLEQGLDYLSILTKTFWKPISSNTIFVTEDNITKRRDYEDNVVRVFYIQNATSVQEFQEIATAVRSLTEIRRVFTYTAQHAILMRGTPDQIALAEKLIHDLDKPKSEVVVDVIVMEANRSRTRDLAAAITSSGSPGLNVPIGFTPRNPILSGTGSTDTTGTGTTGTTGLGTTAASTTSSLISLAQLGRVSTNDFSTTLPGALLQLVMGDRQTRVLQSPQVRASDGQKVTLRIGDKIPYATGAFQAGLGSVGGLPYANTQFNFAEVGVNVDITPTVHGRDEVTLKVAVEVSNVRDRVSIGGIDQPVIGQRRSETEIRLKEGEVNILGGLSQEQNTRSIAGVPGLVNIPILGRLLGSESTDKETGELLIALIPHIVRTPNLTDVDLKGVWAGTDQVPKVAYAPHPEVPGAAAGGTERIAPAPAPTPAKPVSPPPAAIQAPVQTPPTQQPAVPGVPTPSGPQLIITPPTSQAQLSGTLNLTLQAENVQDLFTASPIRIKWDPKVLRLNEIAPGDFLSRDGQRITSAKDIRNDAGEAWVTLNRLPGAGGVSGSGTLATFSFTVIGKGNTKVTVTDFGLKNTQLQPISVTAPEAAVTVP
jgi:general secretion pathway protein D